MQPQCFCIVAAMFLALYSLSCVSPEALPNWWNSRDCSSNMRCRCVSETDTAKCVVAYDGDYLDYRYNCSELKNLPISTLFLNCKASNEHRCGVVDLDLLIIELRGLYTLGLYDCNVSARIYEPASLNKWNWTVKFDWTKGIETSSLAFFLSLQVKENIRKDYKPFDIRPKCLLQKLDIIDGRMFHVPSLLLQRCQSLYFINLTGNYFTDLLPIDLALLFFSDTLEVVEISGGQLYSAGESVMRTVYDAISHYIATEFPKRIANMKKEISDEPLEALEALQRRFQGWTEHTVISTDLMVEIKEEMRKEHNFIIHFRFPETILQTFVAHGNRLLRIPLILMGQREIVSLELQSNNIRLLGPLQLLACDRNKLKSLNLRNNSIMHIPPGTFAPYLGIRIVDLSHNKIDEIETSLFHNTTVLDLLDVSYNAIKQALPFAFNFTIYNISFSHNQITQFSTTIGNFSKDVEVLDLSYNRIQFITSGYLNASNVGKLRLVNLNYNPISVINSDVFLGLSYATLIVQYLPPDVRCNCKSIITIEYDFQGLVYPNVVINQDDTCTTDLYELVTLRNSSADFCFVDGRTYPSTIGNGIQCESVTSHCPYACVCYFKRDFSSVEIECHDTNFKYIPTMYVHATKLHFYKNNFRNIGNNPFNSCMKNVVRISMIRCGITGMRPGLFKDIVNLKSLFLSQNKLQYLDSSVFEGLNYLTLIDLRSNSFVTISPKSFSLVNALNRLKLKGNNLTCDCSTTLPLLEYSREINVLLPDNCTVASNLRVVTKNVTIPLQQSSISHICKLYDHYNANLRNQQFQKSLEIYITTGVIVLVSIILLGLVAMKRVSIKVFLDLHIQATGVRSLFRLRTQHQKEFDVGFLFTDTRTVQHDHLQLCIRKSKRKNLRTVALFHHLPGSARLRGLWSFMKRVEVIVVLASKDLFEDDYYYEALDMIIYETSISGGSNNLIVVQLDDEVSKTDAWKIISCNPRRIFVLRWNEYLFCERLFAALPPPRIDKEINSDDEAGLIMSINTDPDAL